MNSHHKCSHKHEDVRNTSDVMACSGGGRSSAITEDVYEYLEEMHPCCQKEAKAKERYVRFRFKNSMHVSDDSLPTCVLVTPWFFRVSIIIPIACVRQYFKKHVLPIYLHRCDVQPRPMLGVMAWVSKIHSNGRQVKGLHSRIPTLYSLFDRRLIGGDLAPNNMIIDAG